MQAVRRDRVKVGDIKILKKRDVVSAYYRFCVGDEVEIIRISETGCDLKQVRTGNVIYDCSLDLF